jgi:hypothetical protein
MKPRLLLAAVCLISGLAAGPVADEAPPEFIRVEESETATRLQTALTRYTKGDASVELVGAIHIADKAYYEALGKRFEGYDALLYEGIGEPAPAAAQAPAAPAAPVAKGKLDGLHAAYGAGAEWLGLSYQMEEIDYRKPNFVHADLSVAEFSALQAERGESLLGFVLQAGLGKPDKPVKEPSSLKLLVSLARGDKDGLKRELVHTLGQGDDQVAALAGDNVIIGDRNAKCLQVLERELAAGKKKLGIFYGAAHFPDMEKRLLAAGWRKGGSEWLTAWKIGA